MFALAVALMVVVAAAVIFASHGPLTTGAADDGDDTDQPGTNPTNSDQDQTDDVPSDTDDVVVPPAVTTLCVTKTAEGFWERTVTYYWTVDKELNGTDDLRLMEDGCTYSVEIEPGENATVSYVIIADRSDPCVVDVFGVRGVITVTNTGGNATENLTIVDTIMTKACEGDWMDLMAVEVDTSCHPVLAAGESYDYPYEITFAPLSAVDYCNVVSANITNYVGHVDESFGVNASMVFVLPDEPDETDIDDDAVLEDRFGMPPGFQGVLLTEPGPWCLESDDATDHYVFDVSLEITNIDAPRNCTFELLNHAYLALEDSEDVLVACAPLLIYSGPIET